jgi:hypothetical protein
MFHDLKHSQVLGLHVKLSIQRSASKSNRAANPRYDMGEVDESWATSLSEDNKPSVCNHSNEDGFPTPQALVLCPRLAN